MSKVRVHNLAVSLDGYGTGEGQTLEAPFGHAGMRLLGWAIATPTFQAMHGGKHPMGDVSEAAAVDEQFTSRWADGIGAEIMGRNKFGPQRGPWTDEQWRGWWGENPVFHTPVFVLTHHPRPTLKMEGGTTFHFVDATPADALALAKKAAGDRDIRIGGGPSTVREFLAADLIDHLHVAVVPIVLGRGVRLWDGLEGLEKRFNIKATSSPSGVTHLTFERRER